MPYRKTYRKTYKKRKKGAWARKRITAVQPRAAIADSQLVRLRYGEAIAFNNTGGTSATYLFDANGLFDPNRSGTGHQPLGYDQWGAFYNHYTVIGSRIKAHFMPQGSGASTNSYICSLSLEDDLTTSATISDMLEKTGVVYGYCGSAGGNSSLILRKNFSAKKFFNYTDVKDVSGIKSTFLSSPAEGAFYHLNITSADLTTTTGNVTVAVQIEYIVMLSERKTLPQS